MHLSAPRRHPNNVARLANLLSGAAVLLALLAAPAVPAANEGGPAANRAVRPANNAPANAEMEPVELSPFVVATERDAGWVASSTLTGTRTNQELANVPVSVDAITSEFIRDFAAYTMEDAGQYVANLVVTDQLETGLGEGRVSYRGIVRPDNERALSNSSRNFFPSFVQIDNYNVERLDFNKGSNSLMFGDASPGGQTTVYTKRPRFRNFGHGTALYGGDGTHRLQLDVNRKLTDGLAVRLNLVDRDARTYVDFSGTQLRAGSFAAEYRPFKHTALRVEGEAGEFKISRAVNQVRIRTQSAPGRGFSTNNRWYYTSDGEILQRTSSSPAAVDRSGASGDTVTFLEGQTATVMLMNLVGSTSTPSGQTLTLKGFPRSVNFLGPTDHQNRPYNNFTAWLEQKVGDLFFEVAFNQENQRQFRNQGQFGSTISVDRAGRPYVESSLDKRDFGDRAKIGRLSASYPWRLGKWMTQFLVVNAEWQEKLMWSFRHNLANFAVLDTAPTTNIRNHAITVRAYLDDPAFPGRGFFDRLRLENLPVTARFRPGYYELSDVNQPFTDKVYQRTYSASAAGTYFEGRLRTLLGIRHDTATRKLVTKIPQDAIGQDIYLGTPEAVPDAYGYDPTFATTNTCPNAGIVLRVFEGLNAYGTYSESFNWQRAVDFTNAALGPIVGTTREAGLKGDLFRQRLTFTLAAYEINRENTAYEWTPNLLSATEMESLFNANDLRPGDPRYFTVATGFADESVTTTSSQRSRGWEATLQLVRHLGLQARLTFSRNQVTTWRDMSKFRTLYEAAVDRTNTARAPGGNATMAESTALLADATRILAENDGVGATTGPRSALYSFNWAIDYEFPRASPLKGTRVAVYGNWRDDYNILFSGRIYKNGSTHPVGAYAIHRRKLAGRDTSFRLGLKNLIDLENAGTTRVWGISRLNAAGAPEYTYRYVTPVSYDLSMSVDF